MHGFQNFDVVDSNNGASFSTGLSGYVLKLGALVRPCRRQRLKQIIEL
jgi:hypothetical protein